MEHKQVSRAHGEMVDVMRMIRKSLPSTGGLIFRLCNRVAGPPLKCFQIVDTDHGLGQLRFRIPIPVLVSLIATLIVQPLAVNTNSGGVCHLISLIRPGGQ